METTENAAAATWRVVTDAPPVERTTMAVEIVKLLVAGAAYVPGATSSVQGAVEACMMASRLLPAATNCEAAPF